MKNGGLLLVVALLLVLAVLGWAGMTLLAPAAPPPDDERSLAREVAALREAIAELAAPGTGASSRDESGRRTTGNRAGRAGEQPGSGTRALREVLDATDAEQLAEALDKLTAAVTRQNELLEQRTRRGGGGPASLERIERGKTEADWEAWKPIIETWHESPEQARQLLQLLTAEEVMQRFGPPTKVYGHTGGMRWSYLKDYNPRTGDTSGEVFLTFNAGYLTDVAITGL